jgi:O-antigen/teichoic acid export membrane protein
MTSGHHHKNIVSDTIKYIPVTIIRVFAGFLIIPFLTRSFDTEMYGKYIFALSILTFLQIFVNSWVNIAIIRFYAKAEVRQETHILADSILGIVLIFSISISVIGFIVILLVKPYIDDVLFNLLLLIPFALISSILLDFPQQTLRAQRKIGLFSIFTTTSTIMIPLIGILISIMLDGAIIGLIIGLIIVQVVISILAYKVCFRDIPRLKFFNFIYARDLVVFGLPIVPSVAFDTILNISDRFILNAFHGSNNLGIYAANYTISWTIISLVGTLISQSSAPIIASIWEKEGRLSTEQIINRILRTYLTFGIPSVVGLAIIGSQLAQLLLAPEYVEGAVIYPYIAASALFMGIQWIAQRGIMLSNRTDLHLKAFFVGGMCNILLNFVLVPQLGYLGAAISTLIASIVLMILVAYFSSSYITISVNFMSISRIVTSCAVMVIIASYTLGILNSENNVVKIAITCILSSITYGMMLMILKEWQITDIVRILRSYRIVK